MKTRDRDRGSALLICIIVTVIIVGLSTAYLVISIINGKKTSNDMNGLQALYLAEGGAADYIHKLNVQAAQAKAAGTTVPRPQTVTTPLPMSGGVYSVPMVLDYGTNLVDDNNDGATDAADDLEMGFVKFEAWGTYNSINRRLEIVLSKSAGGVFWNAVWAGNSGLDPNYNLEFGGLNGVGDVVEGDIYSGRDLTINDPAAVTPYPGSGLPPNVMYGNPTGYSETSSNANPNAKQGTQNALDIKTSVSNPNISIYEENALNAAAGYVNVKGDLQTLGSQAANNGGYAAGENSSNYPLGLAEAQILDPSQPSHIFRMNPSRSGNTAASRTSGYGRVDTAKDDYYIEDPTVVYQQITTLLSDNGTQTPVNGTQQAHEIQISPASGGNPTGGNHKVYFVDGNLWMSHDGILNFQFQRAAANDPIQITLVVKGNVNYTDNQIYSTVNNSMDAIAVIAIKDSNPLRANVTPQQMVGLGSNGTLPNGMTVAEFQDYSDDSNSAMNSLILSDPADLRRLAQEYNRAFGSGNIFFGDPDSGTVDHFEGFMYAENDFYATGLDSDPSKTSQVEIFGNMTAGNQVNIDRNTSLGYKPLRVRFDDKIKSNRSVPPGLPTTPGFGTGDWVIASWKQIP